LKKNWVSLLGEARTPTFGHDKGKGKGNGKGKGKAVTAHVMKVYRGAEA